MMAAMEFTSELATFRALVADRLGLRFTEGTLDPLGAVLEARMQAAGLHSFEAYRRRLDGAATGPDEWRALAMALTVGETFFFRHADHFRAFTEVVLPALRPKGRPIRILSAGCASGEEAYSLAILAAEHAPGVAVEVVGIDLNPAFLARARLARYSPWSLRGLSESTIHRYFAQDGLTAVLREPFRHAVRFEERNLLDDDAEFWRPGAFDVIFFRNVSIYFAPETTQKLMARFASCLSPDGYLFLGPAESLRGSCPDFRLMSSHDTFYYQRQEPGAPGRQAPQAADGWLEAIERSVGRVAKLHAAPAERPAPEPVGSAAPSWDRSAVMSLFEAERFAEALEALKALPLEAQIKPETRLLMAAALTTMGQLEDAEKACQAVLSQQPRSAGAHYLLALGRDQAGDQESARRHDERAAALDPDFAMPRLHLGLLAVRRGAHGAARRELTAALALLAAETAERVLLFGGGFSRLALEALCRAELARLEARA